MVSPTSRRHTGDLIWMLLAVLAGLLIAVGLYLVLIWAPEAANLGTQVERTAQRIFYFHVAAGWVGFFAFFITAVASIAYLITKRRRWDSLAVSSVEVGITFLTANLISGSLWAKPTWNTWWPWNDPRITTEAIIWLIYVAYLLLRNAIDDPARRGRLSSVYGIVAFISVPITFLSIRLWRTIHPAVIGTASDTAQGGFDMSGNMVTALLFSLATFTLLYFVLLHLRLGLEDLRVRVEELKAGHLA